MCHVGLASVDAAFREKRRLREWYSRLLELTLRKGWQHNAPEDYERADSVAAHCKAWKVLRLMVHYRRGSVMLGVTLLGAYAETILRQFRMLLDPAEPGTQVIVVRDSTASGTTLGYHGAVVSPLARSIFTDPDRPDKWYYRVYVPVLDSEIDVSANRMLRTDRVDHIQTVDDVISQIQFDAIPPPNAAHIYGAYRMRGCGWVHFHFRKCEQPFDTFRLNLPTRSAKLRIRCLVYNVRHDVELDAEFVRHAIGTIVGFDAPPAKDAM